MRTRTRQENGSDVSDAELGTLSMVGKEVHVTYLERAYAGALSSAPAEGSRYAIDNEAFQIRRLKHSARFPTLFARDRAQSFIEASHSTPFLLSPNSPASGRQHLHTQYSLSDPLALHDKDLTSSRDD